MTGTLRAASFARRRKPRPVRASLTRPSWPASQPLS